MSNRKGFTLIEMVIVLAIIGILLSIAYPSLAKISDTSRENDRSRHEYVVNKFLKQYYALNGRYPNQGHDRTKPDIPDILITEGEGPSGKKKYTLTGELLALNDALYEYTFLTLDVKKYTYTYADINGDGKYEISSLHVEIK